MSGEFANGEKQLLGSGSQLSAYIDEWATGLDDELRPGFDFSIEMGKKLADRIGDEYGGVEPRGFVLATETLIYDCHQGVDGFTGERLPSTIAGYSPQTYAIFSMQSEQFARGAFGDDYADEVVALRQAVAQ